MTASTPRTSSRSATCSARYGDAVCRRDEQAWAALLGRGLHVGPRRRTCHARTRGDRRAVADRDRGSTRGSRRCRRPASSRRSTARCAAPGTSSSSTTWPTAPASCTSATTATPTYSTDGGWRFATRRFQLVYRGAMDPGTVTPLDTREQRMSDSSGQELRGRHQVRPGRRRRARAARGAGRVHLHLEQQGGLPGRRDHELRLRGRAVLAHRERAAGARRGGPA